MLGIFGSNAWSTRTPRHQWLSAGFGVLAVLVGGGSQGQDVSNSPGGPPPEAIAACAAKQTGAPCYFRHDARHTITGTCERKQTDLVCVPDRAPPGAPPRGSADSPFGNGATPMDGPGSQDDSGMDGRRPKDGPPPLATGPRPPPEAFDACALGTEGGDCFVQTAKGRVGGLCGLYYGRLACIPPRPPRD
jgi:hypothetical protein